MTPYLYGLVAFHKYSSENYPQIVPFSHYKAMMAFARFRKDQGYEVSTWIYEEDELRQQDLVMI